jgi:hypothetical protein
VQSSALRCEPDLEQLLPEALTTQRKQSDSSRKSIFWNLSCITPSRKNGSDHSDASGGLNQLVRSTGKLKICRRKTASIMAYKSETNPVVANVDVRVVAGFFRQFGHLVHKAH